MRLTAEATLREIAFNQRKLAEVTGHPTVSFYTIEAAADLAKAASAVIEAAYLWQGGEPLTDPNLIALEQALERIATA